MTALIGNEYFIQPSTGKYPLAYTQVKGILSNVLLGTSETVESLQARGFFVVERTDRPEGDVVTEATPVLENGKYKQVWESRPFNAEELERNLNAAKNRALAEVGRKLAAALETGVPFDFGGDYGVLHIQVRDGDRANLTAMRMRTVVNSGDTQMFRTQENIIVSGLDDTDVATMTDAADAGYMALLAQAWVLKDQIARAATVAELPAVPEAFVA